MAYDNTNKGTLGKNKRKTEDTHPEYAGQANIDGVEYWVSGWVKANKDTGERFFSLSYKRKDKRAATKTEPREDGQDSGDIPF